MDFRRITPDDVDQVVEFAIKGMRPDRYPLHLSRPRVRATVEHFMTSPQHFHLAAFDGDRMAGGIAVLVSPMLWFERFEAHIVMLFADAPGAGFRLLRAAMQWFARQPGLRRLHWPLEDDAQAERMQRIAARFGFNRSQRVLLAYKE